MREKSSAWKGDLARQANDEMAGDDRRVGGGAHGSGLSGRGDQIPAPCFCSAAIKRPETLNLCNLAAMFSLLARFHYTVTNVCFCFHNCARKCGADSSAPHFY